LRRPFCFRADDLPTVKESWGANRARALAW
jgi:hypothetical protein